MKWSGLYQKQNYSYAGVIEALSGAPYDVKFISFDEVKADPSVLDGIDSFSTPSILDSWR